MKLCKQPKNPPELHLYTKISHTCPSTLYFLLSTSLRTITIHRTSFMRKNPDCFLQFYCYKCNFHARMQGPHGQYIFLLHFVEHFLFILSNHTCINTYNFCLVTPNSHSHQLAAYDGCRRHLPPNSCGPASIKIPGWCCPSDWSCTVYILQTQTEHRHSKLSHSAITICARRIEDLKKRSALVNLGTVNGRHYMVSLHGRQSSTMHIN